MKMLSIAGLAFVFAALAVAAEDSTTKPLINAPLGTAVQTTGKVAAMHCCAMTGATDTHTVVKLETAQGHTDIVDLGSTAELKSNGIEPKEGQQFSIVGYVGKINDNFVIVAEKMTEPKALAITPAASHELCSVEGIVIETIKMKIDGEKDEHFVTKIQTDNGIAVADLGCCAKMPDTVKHAAGQTLAVTGFAGTLNGKPIIMADSCGNLCHVERASDPKDASANPKNSVPEK